MMKPYEPWEFCKSINCGALIHSINTRKWALCDQCKACHMHTYLREHGQILEEGSVLQIELDALRKVAETVKEFTKHFEDQGQSFKHTVKGFIDSFDVNIALRQSSIDDVDIYISDETDADLDKLLDALAAYDEVKDDEQRGSEMQ